MESVLKNNRNSLWTIKMMKKSTRNLHKRRMKLGLVNKMIANVRNVKKMKILINKQNNAKKVQIIVKFLKKMIIAWSVRKDMGYSITIVEKQFLLYQINVIFIKNKVKWIIIFSLDVKDANQEVYFIFQRTIFFV